ncbi:hypothetical protein FA95DRAFT_1517013 [Auriscalpium vulgare]|uniref:Uncharacterized protein n=1 Tax=Auriscalpium vulgare TaxID=40419 RepID=A0ACB8RWZ1_9AGAM|nr:hypothetical protein FA95DRAFT_1517013 [Auriscalpium vulgare]
MVQATVHTALNIAIAASYPSINCLRWTEDGQILFLTKTAVYIMTSDLGVNIDSSSAVRSRPAGQSETSKDLGWFRTIIELDKRAFHHWPSDSQEWAAVALGVLDMSLQLVTASPSNLTSEAGCVLAVINSNVEVSLWCARKDHLRGQWEKLQDVTSFLTSMAAMRTDVEVQRTLQAQTNCAAWSKQCDFGIRPVPVCDNSLLALGSRAGCVNLFRFRAQPIENNYLEHVATVEVAEGWITHLSWLPWTSSRASQGNSMLACGIADGSVKLLQVQTTLIIESGASSLGAQYRLETLAQLCPGQPCDADKRRLTALEWVTPRAREPILVLTKPGVVSLWSAESTAGAWHGLRSVTLQRQAISTGTSALHPVIGIEYSRRNDSLLCALFDGSFHVIHAVSSGPTLEPPAGADRGARLSSWDLSCVSRAVFAQTERKIVQKSDVNSISGLISLDGLPTVAWAHEGISPSDFSYKHEAKHNNTFVIAELWKEDEANVVIERIVDTLSSASAGAGAAPIHVLRPLFLHLLHPERLAQVQPQVLQLLQSRTGALDVPHFDPPRSDNLTEALREELRDSFRRHLFGSDGLFSMRLRLALADFCWKCSTTPESQGECGAVAQGLLNDILHHVLHIHLRHVAAFESLLTETDVTFVYRIIVQALLQGTPPHLFREAEQMRMRLDATFPGSAGSLEEKCPACGVPIPLEDISIAKCLNGHTWSRCSITSFVLATPMVRTCIGCTRKAFVPPLRTAASGDNVGTLGEAEAVSGTRSQKPDAALAHLPSAARSWIVQELLQAVRRCLFCGNALIAMI